MKSFGRNVTSLILVAVVVACGFYYRDTISKASVIIKQVIFPAKPCEEPIPYSLGQFDVQFGLSREQFLDRIEQAEKIWESAVGRDLFVYADEAELKINLTYDYRQKATTELAKVNEVIKSDKVTYDRIKSQYNSLTATYKQQKSSIDSAVRAHEMNITSYEQQVSYWNSHGGAPRDEYAKLESMRQSLNNETIQIDLEYVEDNTVISHNKPMTKSILLSPSFQVQ